MNTFLVSVRNRMLPFLYIFAVVLGALCFDRNKFYVLIDRAFYIGLLLLVVIEIAYRVLFHPATTISKPRGVGSYLLSNLLLGIVLVAVLCLTKAVGTDFLSEPYVYIYFGILLILFSLAQGSLDSYLSKETDPRD